MCATTVYTRNNGDKYRNAIPSSWNSFSGEEYPEENSIGKLYFSKVTRPSITCNRIRYNTWADMPDTNFIYGTIDILS